MDVSQRSLRCYRKGEHANVTPFTLEAPLMRLSVRSLRRVVKGDLPIEFVQQDLTSYGGLELVRRYLHRLDVLARLRRAVADVPSDYGGGRRGPFVGGVVFARAPRPGDPRGLARDHLIARVCCGCPLPPPPTIPTTAQHVTP